MTGAVSRNAEAVGTGSNSSGSDVIELPGDSPERSATRELMAREIKGFRGMQVMTCEGPDGAQDVNPPDYSPYLTQARLEIIAPDKLCDSILKAVGEVAYTGNSGAVRILVTEVLGAIASIRANTAISHFSNCPLS